MVDDRPENQGSLPESERPKREPPTIDLDATRSDQRDRESKRERACGGSRPPSRAVEAAGGRAGFRGEPLPQPAPAPVSPWIVAPVSGAVAAALVIGVGWMLGWPAVQPAARRRPQLNAAAIDDLTARVAGLETKISKPPRRCRSRCCGADGDAGKIADRAARRTRNRRARKAKSSLPPSMR